MKTLCIVACHTDSLLKINAISHNDFYLREIADDIIYINSEEFQPLKMPFSMMYVKNDSYLCYSKYLHVLNTITLKEYDQFILTNDSFIITRSLTDYKALFLNHIERTGIVASNEISYHVCDFLVRYNKKGIKKAIVFYKERISQTYKNTIDLIYHTEVQFPKMNQNVLFDAIPNYNGNVHFDKKKYKNYPILKIKYIQKL
jgi:hypothetical protein